MNKQRFHKNFNGEQIFCLENDKETFKDMVLELQERIDKSIGYIKEHIRQDAEYPYYMEMLVEEKDELLNILQGEDKDE